MAKKRYDSALLLSLLLLAGSLLFVLAFFVLRYILLYTDWIQLN
ncbi:hypothetical protein ACP26L_13100 [Paenibacillus sp. S-38]